MFTYGQDEAQGGSETCRYHAASSGDAGVRALAAALQTLQLRSVVQGQ